MSHNDAAATADPALKIARSTVVGEFFSSKAPHHLLGLDHVQIQNIPACTPIHFLYTAPLLTKTEIFDTHLYFALFTLTLLNEIQHKCSICIQFSLSPAVL
ncbi:hypothetical protein AMECASPLE_018754 [Ameca splendens]|uniref:Uncharacterized protein n=1 Tax=Ameca splendens TaxID=208324 RepID=A0ABV0Y2M5_9TELE